MNQINFNISKLSEIRDALSATIDGAKPIQTLQINKYGTVRFSHGPDDEGDHLPGGGCAMNMIAAYANRDNFYEPLVAAVFIELGCQLDEIRLIDVGALWGNTSFVAGTTSNKIISHMFEMNPYTCDVLRRNVKLNEDANKKYTVNNVLLANSNEDVEVTFKHYTARYKNGLGGSDLSKFKIMRRNIKSKLKEIFTGKNIAKYETVKLPVVKLDQFIEQSKCCPNVIKIDVEGSQYDILLGAQKYISAQKPILLVEFDEPGAANYIGKSNRDVVAFLESNGYQCIWGDHREKYSPLFKIDSKTEHDIEKNSLGIFY